LYATKAGFTLIEILVVVVILSIAAAMVLPMVSSASSLQARAAADMVYADLEYVRGLAMSQGKVYRMTFDTGNESYHVDDQNGNILDHPVRIGQDYAFVFPGSRLGNVDLVSVNFDTQDTIAFDYLAIPYSYNSITNAYTKLPPNAPGEIVLQASGVSYTLSIEPETGNVTIQ
jgi:prepilin-type N-terminal cleavage/methylation domain-containing protein